MQYIGTLAMFLFFFATILSAQPIVDLEGDMGIGTTFPDPTALLDLNSKKKGLLIPRMTTAERDSMQNPAPGLIIFNLDTHEFQYNRGDSLTAFAGGKWSCVLADATLGNNAWLLKGNAGTQPGENFLGTTDDVPFEIHVYSTYSKVGEGTGRALRIEPTAGASSSPNLIGGIRYNSMLNSVGGVISGGGSADAPNFIGGNFSTIGGGRGDSVRGAYNTISGGLRNRIFANQSTIGGGRGNLISFDNALPSGVVIAGGENNEIRADGGSIGGGEQNSVWGEFSAIGGGSENSVNGDYAVVAGGSQNSLSGGYATVGGGRENMVAGLEGTVSGGVRNNITNGGRSGVIAGGASNLLSGEHSVIGGGSFNVVTDTLGVISGGAHNRVGSSFGTIGGGRENEVRETSGTISGGEQNRVEGSFGTVGGGSENIVVEWGATVGGGIENIASGSSSSILGGFSNEAGGRGSTVGGGIGNSIWIEADGGTVAGGSLNGVSAENGSIGGGFNNFVFLNAFGGTVAGGHNNSVQDSLGTISGGYLNSVEDSYGVVSGGEANVVRGWGSTITGGVFNKVRGALSTIAGGRRLDLGGDGSFGFMGGDASAWNNMRVDSSSIALFANVDLWLGGNMGEASELRFFEAQWDTGAFPGVQTHYTSFRAGSQSEYINYTLPSSLFPTAVPARAILQVDSAGRMSWIEPRRLFGSGWKTEGNAGTNPSADFLGTTDSVALTLRTDNVERGRITPTGNFGIGDLTPEARLDVENNSEGEPTLELTNGQASGTALRIVDGRMTLSYATYTANDASGSIPQPVMGDDVIVVNVSNTAIDGTGIPQIDAPATGKDGQVIWIVNSTATNVLVGNINYYGATTAILGQDSMAQIVWVGGGTGKWILLQ